MVMGIGHHTLRRGDMNDDDIKTHFEGPGQWLSQANELEESDDSGQESEDDLLE